MIKKIIMADHHGFCMGVKRAIQIAEETAEKSEKKVTILNEIVHNEAVVENFRQQGVAQAFSLDEVNEGTLIISAPLYMARALAATVGISLLFTSESRTLPINDFLDSPISTGRPRALKDESSFINLRLSNNLLPNPIPGSITMLSLLTP